MKLQILVSQYKEDETVIGNLLHSIAIQQDVDRGDFEVIICNDGSDVKLSEPFLSSFPFKITYLFNGFIEHGGVSKTRNRLLSYSTADYIMFCDADDMFTTAFGLKEVFFKMEEGFDLLVSTFLGQSRDFGDAAKRHYLTIKYDRDFVHGKVFNKQFLIENDIHFNDELIFSGDNYFLLLVFAYVKKIAYIDNPFYLWVWNEKSVCRKEKNHFWNTYRQRIKADCLIIDEFLRRENTYQATNRVIETIQDYYTILHMKTDYDETDIKENNKIFVDFIIRYHKLILSDTGKEIIKTRKVSEDTLIWLEKLIKESYERSV